MAGMADFDLSRETEKIYTALDKVMKGLRTDDEVLIEILTVATDAQRQAITENYKLTYDQNLEEDIAQATSGNFSRLTGSLLKNPAQYDATCLKESMEWFRTDTDVLIAVICTSKNEEIRQMSDAYTELYGRNLEADVRNKTSGDLEVLLASVLQAGRSEDQEVNSEKATTDASEMYDAINATFGTDKSIFTSIFANRSAGQLRATFDEYARIAKKNLLDDIADKISGKLALAYRTIGLWATDECKYYAESLYKSMKGFGTKDVLLIRGILKNYQTPNMNTIKQIFLREYGDTLAKWIEDDTSGYYRQALLALVAKAASGDGQPGQVTEPPAEQPPPEEQPAEQPAEQPTEPPAEQPPPEEQPAEQPAEQPTEQPPAE